MKLFSAKAEAYMKDELFFGSLPTFQSEPLDTILMTCLDNGILHPKQQAYVLATAYHESDRFKAKEEYGKGKGRDYADPILLIRGKYKGYWGRGWVQLTWLSNYAKFSARLTKVIGKEIDLVNDPEMITRDDSINAYILVVGMKDGMFTGKSLDDYLGDDYYNARRIVNGTMHATEVAAAAVKFEQALEM